MPKAPKLIVMNMSAGGSVTVAPFLEVLEALTRHHQISTYEELDAYLDNPSGIALVFPFQGRTSATFDIEGVRSRAEETGLAVQNLTMDLIQKFLDQGKTAKQIIEQLGL